MHLPCNDGDPSNSIPAFQESFCGDSLMDKVIEHQVGSGPSPYHLRSNINLTPQAAEESWIAAGLCCVHYNDGSSAAMDPLDDTEVLLSMCVDAPIEQTLTPPHHHVHPWTHTPPNEVNNLFSTLPPLSPLTSGPSHLSDCILDQTLQILDFIPVVPTWPAVHRPQPTFHAVDKEGKKEEGGDKEGGDDQHALAMPPPLACNMDDNSDSDILASLHG